MTDEREPVMPGYRRLTPDMQAALVRLSAYSEHASVKWASRAQLGIKQGVLTALVRAGLARSCKQTEGCRHEGLITYALYQATPLGLEKARGS